MRDGHHRRGKAFEEPELVALPLTMPSFKQKKTPVRCCSGKVLLLHPTAINPTGVFHQKEVGTAA